MNVSKAADQFKAITSAQDQQARVIEARAKLQNCYWSIQETNDSIQKLKDAGDLDALPAELLQGMKKIWNAIKTCQASIEALAEKDLLS